MSAHAEPTSFEQIVADIAAGKKCSDGDVQRLRDLLATFATSFSVTLSEIGMRASAQAEAAGYFCVQEAWRNARRSFPGLWLKKTDLPQIVTTAREIEGAQQKAEIEKAQRLIAQQARSKDRRALLVRRARSRLGISDELAERFATAVNVVPATRLAKRYDADTRTMWNRTLDGETPEQAFTVVRQRRREFENTVEKLSPDERWFYEKLKTESNGTVDTAIASAEFDKCAAIVRAATKVAYAKVAEIMASPPSWFPLARGMNRRLEYIAGPTNSGKTHEAMLRLSQAKSGIYLAPLRLLAHEVGARLRDEYRVSTAIITGEERDEQAGWTHCSCTIEMLNPSRRWDVAVIDEAQMLADPERGWAWTHAIMGVAARTVVILGAPAAEPIVRQIATATDEPLEVRHLQRLGPLQVIDEPVPLCDVPDHSAVIAFSRRGVLSLREKLQTEGRQIAVIYGALSPTVRRREAAHFRNGQAAIVVTTDAIGMGLNLPAERVLFWELTKFDGQVARELNHSEILQIAGRAGRHGLSPTGFVGTIAGGPAQHKIDALRNALACEPEPLPSVLPVTLSPELAERIAAPAKIGRLAMFQSMNHPRPEAPWRWSVPPVYFEVAALWPMRGTSPIRVQAQFSSAPASMPEDKGFLSEAAQAIERGEKMDLNLQLGGDLEELEKAWKRATLYLWLAIRWPEVFVGRESAVEKRQTADERISDFLKNKRLVLRCSRCEKPLNVGHRFAICDACHRPGPYF